MQEAGERELYSPKLAGANLALEPDGLAKADEELELRVAERTAELSLLNRELKAIAGCNRTLLHSSSEHGLLSEICQHRLRAGRLPHGLGRLCGKR